MPTIKRVNRLRFFFYSNEHQPIHIHVEDGNKTAKFNISPIELVYSKGFNATEINKIRQTIEQNVELFKKKWYEYFNY
ncbi:MAG: hypothetical protein CVV25_11630 [Ignavibacteriae bacterium HGW-Ignavibacteriae-4]|nr:MAG: hypothetical protein CVV25_11630 [Ignavibacteriae bacterium HGW-Ignavibacteriae-4]